MKRSHSRSSTPPTLLIVGSSPTPPTTEENALSPIAAISEEQQQEQHHQPQQGTFSPPPLSDFDELLFNTSSGDPLMMANNPPGYTMSSNNYDYVVDSSSNFNYALPLTCTIKNVLEDEEDNSQKPKRGRRVTLGRTKRNLFHPTSTPLGPNGEHIKKYIFDGLGERPCIICDKMYVCKKFLQRHKVAKHRLCKPVHQLDCEHCGAVFADVDSFTMHCNETELQIKEFYDKGLYQKKVQKKNSDKHTNTRKIALLQKRREKEDDELKMAAVLFKEENEDMFTCDICLYVGNLETIKAHVSSQHPVDNEAQMESHISPMMF